MAMKFSTARAAGVLVVGGVLASSATSARAQTPPVPSANLPATPSMTPPAGGPRAQLIAPYSATPNGYSASARPYSASANPYIAPNLFYPAPQPPAPSLPTAGTAPTGPGMASGAGESAPVSPAGYTGYAAAPGSPSDGDATLPTSYSASRPDLGGNPGMATMPAPNPAAGPAMPPGGGAPNFGYFPPAAAPAAAPPSYWGEDFEARRAAEAAKKPTFLKRLTRLFDRRDDGRQARGYRDSSTGRTDLPLARPWLSPAP